MTYAQQLAEITGMQDHARQQFGRRLALFRPPEGAYSNVMQKAVADAGLKATIIWDSKAPRRPQRPAPCAPRPAPRAPRPGDIVLMHFPEFATDLAAFRQAQLAAALEAVLLEDFVGAS